MNKNVFRLKKSIISIIAVACITFCGIAGCSLDSAIGLKDGNVNNFLSREDVQANVDSILSDLENTKNEDSDEFTQETVDVKNKKSFGDIYETIYHPGTGDKYSPFTILEITPVTEYSMFSYLIGGREPVDAYGLDALANQEIGTGDCQIGKINSYSNLLGRNNETASNYICYKHTMCGYFEKVPLNDPEYRHGHGGAYALKMESVDGMNIPLLSGRFVENKGKGNYKLYDPNAYNENSGPDLTNTIYTAGGYKYDNGNSNTRVFVPISSGETGNYDFEFKSIEKYYGVYAASKYYYYDFDNKEQKTPDGYGKYEWVWNELPDSEYEEEDINYFEINSEKKNTISFDTLCDLPLYSKLYVRDYTKYHVHNNEIFLLQCMGLSEIENSGLFDSYGNIIQANMDELNKYYGGTKYNDLFYANKLNELGDKISVLVRTPDKVSSDDIKKANLIVFVSGDMKIVSEMQKIYSVEHTYVPDWKSDYEEDLSASRMIEIYKKVINNDVTIAYDREALLKTGKNNIKNLGIILFDVDNSNLVYDPNTKLIRSKDASIISPYITGATCTQDEFDALVQQNNVANGGNVDWNFLGRYILADFIESFYEDNIAYSSLVKNGKVISDKYPYEYVKFNESSGVLQPLSGSNISGTEWKDLFDPNNGVVSQSKLNGYYKDQGFNFCSGITRGGGYASYANEVLFTNNTEIMKFSGGTLWALKAAIKQTNDRVEEDKTVEHKKIGEIEIVGAGFRGKDDKFSSRHNPLYTDVETNVTTTIPYTYDECNVWYDNPVTISYNKDKVIYMTRQEYMRANKHQYKEENEFCIYAVATTSTPVVFKELDIYRVGDGDPGEIYLKYKENNVYGTGDNIIRQGAEKKYYSAGVPEAYNVKKDDWGPRFSYEPQTPEPDPNAAEPAATPEKVYITEFVFRINPQYFEHAFAYEKDSDGNLLYNNQKNNNDNPDNSGNNTFELYFQGRSEGDNSDFVRFQGYDKVQIIVRDDFDLD